MLEPSCGACAGCGPGSSTAPDQITVSAINRNFPGRSGPGKVWLASPATVATVNEARELGQQGSRLSFNTASDNATQAKCVAIGPIEALSLRVIDGATGSRIGRR